MPFSETFGGQIIRTSRKRRMCLPPRRPFLEETSFAGTSNFLCRETNRNVEQMQEKIRCLKQLVKIPLKYYNLPYFACQNYKLRNLGAFAEDAAPPALRPWARGEAGARDENMLFTSGAPFCT